MPSIQRLSSRSVAGQSLRKFPPANVPPQWMGAGSTSNGLGFIHRRYVYTLPFSCTFRLEPGDYRVTLYGGAGGYSKSANGGGGGGAGGGITHFFTVATTTNATMVAGLRGGNVPPFGGSQPPGRRGLGGLGYNVGGDGAGTSTGELVVAYSTPGVYSFTSPGTTGQTCIFEILMMGGSGGAGGSDTGAGGNGGPAKALFGTYIGPANTTFNVLVGSAGGGGSSAVTGTGGGSAGATSGVFAGTYQGGRGGNAGGSGTSGGGGGGGGATVLRHPTLGDILIAAGGGGGGGGGNNTGQPGGRQGRNGSLYNVATANTNGTQGEDKGGDGGGGGGGGGGQLGGLGGTNDGSDFGGNGGNVGKSYVYPGLSFTESFVMNGGLQNGGSGANGYFRVRCQINANPDPAPLYNGAGGGGSSYFSVSGLFTLIAPGGGGAGGGSDSTNATYPSTAGGKVGNDASGGLAGTGGAAGASGTSGSGGGGGSANTSTANYGGGGKGGVATLPAGAGLFVGSDGRRFVYGEPGGQDTEQYTILSSFVNGPAKGGPTLTDGNGGILIEKITSAVVPSYTIDYVVVGGGGAGGGNGGNSTVGGGGGGGVVTGSITITKYSTFRIEIGAGGTGRTGSLDDGRVGNPGQPTYLYRPNGTIISADGGNPGAYGYGGMSGNGFGALDQPNYGGGGAGEAAGAGDATAPYEFPGRGVNPVAAQNGSPVGRSAGWFGAGGAGYNGSAREFFGGGGAFPAGNGTANSGGGSAAAGFNAGAGGNAGSGTVLLRIPDTVGTISNSSGAPSINTITGYIIYAFKGNGTFTL